MSAEHDALIDRLKVRITQDPAPELVGRSEVLPRASDAELDATDAALDAPLPALLRRIYREVANGGFGPGYGLLGAVGGYSDEDVGGNLVDAYRELRRGGDPDEAPVAASYRRPSPTDAWPRGLLVLINLGCAKYVCLATEEFDGSLVVHDDAGRLTVTSFTLSWLLGVWCDDKPVWDSMHECVGEREGVNPFTRMRQVIRIMRPRGYPWPGYVPPQ